MNTADEMFAVALLAEPVRRDLYFYLRDRHEPVGREEAARAVGISSRLAAFHLDRLAEAGLLDVDYRRLTGRTGPGAGRPAKVYSVSPVRMSVSIPQTRYVLAATMMATALSEEHSGADGAAAARRVAGRLGRRLGAELRAGARTKGARRSALRQRLEELGYEPKRRGSKELTLRNCIFADLAQSHRELVCGMNAELVRGILAGAELSSLHVEGRVEQPSCCVRIVGR